jgi:predicted ester cyclase
MTEVLRRSLVATNPPPDASLLDFTAEEQNNLDVILRLRAAPFTERKNFMHPQMRHHRWGFMSLADITGMKDGRGYDARSISGRVDTIEDIIAKGDRVWAVWTMRGIHAGQLFGIPATGRNVEVLEAGVWRLVDGLVAEAWFFGDEVALLRQLGLPIDRLVAQAATEAS